MGYIEGEGRNQGALFDLASPRRTARNLAPGYRITLRRPNKMPSMEYAPAPMIVVDTHNMSVTILTKEGPAGNQRR